MPAGDQRAAVVVAVRVPQRGVHVEAGRQPVGQPHARVVVEFGDDHRALDPQVAGLGAVGGAFADR